MGGGGFMMEPENPLLDQYILNLIGKTRPKICFLPQASGEWRDGTLNFYRTFTRLGAEPSDLSLFQPHTYDIEGFLKSQDAVYVGGGNTKSMLALWREWGLDRILREANAGGTVLAGVSAGANCWFEECSTDSVFGRLSVIPCLGCLQGSFCPHYDGENERRPWLLKTIGAGEMRPGWAMDDGAAAHFVDGQFQRVVTSRPHARGFYVAREADLALETQLDTSYLGKR
ncbi:MAG: peptidase E [Anaerolineae bacterium]|nr:peptidase E [Anaerolineae bacterium]